MRRVAVAFGHSGEQLILRYAEQVDCHSSLHEPKAIECAVVSLKPSIERPVTW